MPPKTKDAPAGTAAPTEKPAEAGVPQGEELELSGGALDPVHMSTEELLARYEDTAGAGMEEADKNAFAIPFLIILQSGSPQCKRSEGEYIQGAEEGMLYNTVTKKIYKAGPEDPPLHLISCHYQQRFIEWEQRENGGGFIAEHLPSDPIVRQTTKDEKNRDVLGNGHNLVDTRNHYSIFMPTGEAPQTCVVSMSSTQVKKSRNWMSRIGAAQVVVGGKLIKPPMFAQIFRVTTVPEQNEKGSWWGWKIEPAGRVTDANLFQMAEQLYRSVKSGEAKADTAGMASAMGTNNEETIEA